MNYTFKLPPRNTIAYYYTLAAIGIGINSNVLEFHNLNHELTELRLTLNEIKKLGQSLLIFFKEIYGGRNIGSTKKPSLLDIYQVLLRLDLIKYYALPRNLRIRRIINEIVKMAQGIGFTSLIDQYPSKVRPNYLSVVLSYINDLIQGNIAYMKNNTVALPQMFRTFLYSTTRGFKIENTKNINIEAFSFGLALIGALASLLHFHTIQENRKEKSIELHLIPDGSILSLSNAGLIYEIYHNINKYGERINKVLDRFTNLKGISADAAIITGITAYLIDVLRKYPHVELEFFDNYLLVKANISGYRVDVVWISPFPSTILKYRLSREIIESLYNIYYFTDLLERRIPQNLRSDFEEKIAGECRKTLSTCIISLLDYTWTGLRDPLYLCSRILKAYYTVIIDNFFKKYLIQLLLRK